MAAVAVVGRDQWGERQNPPVRLRVQPPLYRECVVVAPFVSWKMYGIVDSTENCWYELYSKERRVMCGLYGVLRFGESGA